MADKIETTRVIFRRWKNDGKTVIALFPRELCTNSPYTCSSYEHVGQHGSADPVGVIAASRAASLDDADVSALKRELEGRDYKLQVVKRHTQTDLNFRKDAIDAMP